MALYAVDEDEPIFAADANPSGSYRCLECGSPVKARRGKNRVPHFYHLQKSSRCRLYSKSEDHLVLQLELQKLLSKSAKIECPIPDIHRISDLLWEKERIAFEIQCSSITPSEAKQRVCDYRRVGYEIVWLLDDRIFNKRQIRSAEEFLRTQICYYFSFNRIGPSYFYDQMEIIIAQRRLKKGYPMRVDLSRPRLKPFFEWPPALPTQVQERIMRSERYFRGDLLHKALQAPLYPSISIHFERWRKLEVEMRQGSRLPSWGLAIFKRYIVIPYICLLDWLIEKVNR